MSWLAIIIRYWKPLAIIAAMVGIALTVRSYGHRQYESGYAASEAKWQPKFDAAERELTAANERAHQKEADSKALTQKVEADHEKAIASLTSRAADAERGNVSLLRKLSTGSSYGAVPKASGPAAGDPAAAEVQERLDGIARRLTGIATNALADAIELESCQAYAVGQAQILNR